MSDGIVSFAALSHATRVRRLAADAGVDVLWRSELLAIE